MATSSGTAYASLTDLHQELGLPVSTTGYDLSMQLALDVATVEISDYCGRSFLASTGQTRYYTAEHGSCLLTDDILAITALRTDADQDGTYETSWSTAAYYLAPFNATCAPNPGPYTQIQTTPLSSGVFPVCVARGVQIVGTFGYALTVPPIVKKACLFQAALDFRSKDAPMGAIGGRGFGQEITAPMSLGLHPFARRQLDFYRRRIVA